MRIGKRQSIYYNLRPHRHHKQTKRDSKFHCYVKLRRREGYAIYAYAYDGSLDSYEWKHIGYEVCLPDDDGASRGWASIHERTTKEYIELQVAFEK